MFKAIPYNGSFNFNVKIIKAANRYIGIGVVDVKQYKTIANSFYDSAHVVSYYWWYENQGDKYPAGGIEGIGYE